MKINTKKILLISAGFAMFFLGACDQPPQEKSQSHKSSASKSEHPTLIKQLRKADPSNYEKLIEDALANPDKAAVKAALSETDKSTDQTVGHFLAKVSNFKPALLKSICDIDPKNCIKQDNNYQASYDIAANDQKNVTKEHMDVYAAYIDINKTPFPAKLAALQKDAHSGDATDEAKEQRYCVFRGSRFDRKDFQTFMKKLKALTPLDLTEITNDDGTCFVIYVDYWGRPGGDLPSLAAAGLNKNTKALAVIIGDKKDFSVDLPWSVNMSGQKTWVKISWNTKTSELKDQDLMRVVENLKPAS